MKKSAVKNRLSEIRKRRGASAAELAQRVGVSRQTVYAIEAGTYVPNTEVALRLAHALEVSVDELFHLEDAAESTPQLLPVELLTSGAPAAGQAVRVGRVGERWIAVPASPNPYYLPDADGVVRRRRRAHDADVAVHGTAERADARLIVAGCDPAMELLAHAIHESSGVEVIPAAASSRLALRWLKEGKVHIAGSHLEDPETGEFNVPFIRREFPGEELHVVTFARWEEGLVIGKGNPKGIRRVEDLVQRDLTFINRERGSGSRALLDRLLKQAGVEARRIGGYERIAGGHLEAAYAVASGGADACIATRSAARGFGLDFVPLQCERYDFVLRKDTMELPAVRDFLDALQRAALRRKLEAVAGYDMSQTGALAL